jgi:hypothetical protein
LWCFCLVGAAFIDCLAFGKAHHCDIVYFAHSKEYGFVVGTNAEDGYFLSFEVNGVIGIVVENVSPDSIPVWHIKSGIPV